MMASDPRRALQVTRYHTWPRLREQSVGEHSMQVMRILLALWPDCPRHLLVHCLTHDIGEATSGDPPYPVKRDNPALKAECDRIERDAHLAMCIPWMLPPPQPLFSDEYGVFKLCEFIEMWEWALYELRLGNDYADMVRERCWEAIEQLMAPVAAFSQAINKNAASYLARREKIDGRQIHVSSAFAQDRQSGHRGSNGEGPELRSQLEETRRDRGVHDAREKVGPS